MIDPYKSRTIDPRKPVQVYRNLGRHTPRRWSVKQGSLVIGHSDQLYITDCKFRVSESGRQKVIATGQKNVHAMVTGFLSEDSGEPMARAVHYDPFTSPSFLVDGRPVSQSPSARITDRVRVP